MRYLVTGCAGFIGSSLVDRLLERGDAVTGFDNFSTGLPAFLENAKKSYQFKLIQDDLLNREAVSAAMEGVEAVFHLAANADVRFAVVEDQEQVDKLLEIRDRCPDLASIVFDDPRGLRNYSEPGLVSLDQMMDAGKPVAAAQPGQGWR